MAARARPSWRITKADGRSSSPTPTTRPPTAAYLAVPRRGRHAAVVVVGGRRGLWRNGGAVHRRLPPDSLPAGAHDAPAARGTAAGNRRTGHQPVRRIGAFHLGPSLRAGAAAGRREGAELRIPCRTVITGPEPWEDTARLAPGQRSSWPMALHRDVGRGRPVTDSGSGGRQSRRRVPHRPRRRAGPSWPTPPWGWGSGSTGIPRCSGGSSRGSRSAAPTPCRLRGAYGLGIEPWTSGGNLEAAMASGEAVALPGHGQLETTVSATITGG